MNWHDVLNTPINQQGEFASHRFYGDARRAKDYLPVAYALLGEVKQQMAMSDISYGHRQIVLHDGTRIRVIRNFEQNIVEITAESFYSDKQFVVRRFGYSFYPRRSGYPSGFVRPVTETKPYGTRADYPWTLVETLGHISYLSLQYVEDQANPDLSVVRCSEFMSGNQFEFNEFDVYSWWGSPCGDGPLAVYRLLEEYMFAGLYRPFMFADLVCFLYPGCVLEPIPPICPTFLMRNGGVINDYHAHILGLKIITYEENDLTISQGIVALYSGGVSCGLFHIEDGELVTGTYSIVSPSDLNNGDPELSYEFAWPWRFNDDGTEISGIVREIRKYKTVATPVPVALLIITVPLRYFEGIITSGEPLVTRYERPEYWQRVHTVDADLASSIKSGGLSFTQKLNEKSRTISSVMVIGNEVKPGDLFSDNLITTVETRVGEYQVPFALDYIDNVLVPLIVDVKTSFSSTDTKTLKALRNFRETVTMKYEYIEDEHGDLAGTNYQYKTSTTGGETNHFVQTIKEDRTVSYSGTAEGITINYESSSPMTLDFSHVVGTLDSWSGSITGWSVYDSVIANKLGLPPSQVYSAPLSSTVNRPDEISYTKNTTDDRVDLKIPYIKLRARSMIRWEVGGRTQDVWTVSRTQGNHSYQYQHVKAGPTYLLQPIWNAGYPSISTPPVQSSGTEKVSTDVSDMDFTIYGTTPAEYQHNETRTEYDDYFWYGNIYSSFLYGIDAHYTTADDEEYIGGDPTNGWVSVYNAAFSVAADYVRPLVLEKPPSFLAQVSIPNYSQQASTFGNPEHYIEDKPILYPVGLY